MRYAALLAVLLMTATVNAQNPQTIAFTAGFDTPCDGQLREGYWGNTSGHDVQIQTLRLQQRVAAVYPTTPGVPIIEAATNLTGTVLVTHPGDTGQRQLLKTTWGPDAEPRHAHDTRVELIGAIVVRHGDWLTLQTQCSVVVGESVTHDATVFVTLVNP